MERLQKIVLSNDWRNQPALMLLDIDNMKMVNEQYGFAAGDKVIANTGTLFLKGFRNTDLIARYSSDCFAVVIEHLNTEQLTNLASQVVATVASAPHAVTGGTIAVTTSAGLAYLEEGMDLSQWLKSTEEALYLAKIQGKNRSIVRRPAR